jgi:hypothetical protein
VPRLGLVLVLRSGLPGVWINQVKKPETLVEAEDVLALPQLDRTSRDIFTIQTTRKTNDRIPWMAMIFPTVNSFQKNCTRLQCRIGTRTSDIRTYGDEELCRKDGEESVLDSGVATLSRRFCKEEETRDAPEMAPG